MSSARGPKEPAVPVVRVQVEPDAALLERIAAVLRSGRLSNDGPVVRELEAATAEFLGAGEVLAVSNGTAALEVALAAAVPRPGAAVLPAYTFAATVNATVACGLEPIFCDIDAATFTLDPAALATILAQRRDVRAVLPVNVFGVPPDLAAIGALAERAGAVVVLDNAHGLGTEVDGRRLAPEPRVQTFSLHATKVMPAGEGGLIATTDARLAALLRQRRSHGLAAEVLESTPGTNAKMSELTAALALHSLRALPERLARRRAYATRLHAALAATGGVFAPQRCPAGVRSNHQDLGVRCRVGAGGLAEVAALFRAQGVETRRYFWPPLHRLPAWRGRFDLPVTDAVADSLLCLPLHSRMDEPTLQMVEAAIRVVGERLHA